MVDEILDRWHSPDCEYFKIQADDGNRYLLRCNFNGEWMLEKMFLAQKSVSNFQREEVNKDQGA
jgi:hypothetical protein